MSTMGVGRGRRLGRRGAWMLAPVLAALLVVPATARERYHPALDPDHFPVPASIVPNVEFWRAIFSTYTTSQTVIHDNEHLDVIFAVVDVSDLVRSGSSAFTIERTRQRREREQIDKYRQVLRRLAGDTRAQASPDDVTRVRALYARSARRATDYRAAAERVRGQSGLKDKFAEAIRVSGMFMPGIERILRQHGLPLEIRCMPFVESMYNHRARSKVGASGVWQFMPATGRQFLRIDAAVDERNDVLIAADAAARMLKRDHASIGSWPLALTGYNHGIAGMHRAARQLGTKDIGVIAQRYQSPTFGFASRNFYAEFVAAVTVFAERATLFPGVDPMPGLAFDEFPPGRFVSLLDLASMTGADVDQLVTLNPALEAEVVAGRMLVPPSYPLRVPPGTGPAFEQAFADLPDSRKPSRQIGRTYRVARGDTLGSIARRFDTSVTALQQANRLGRTSLIRVGQVLEIGSGGGWSPLVWEPSVRPVRVAAAGESQLHAVRPGDTVYGIAMRYGLSVAAIVAANELESPHQLAVGTVLTIPVAP